MTISKLNWKKITVFLLTAVVLVALGFFGAQYSTQRVGPLTQPGYPQKGLLGQAPSETQQVPSEQPKGPEGRAPSDIATLPSLIPDLSSKVIKSASLSVKIKKGSFQRSFSRAIFVAESLGGYVSSSISTATDDSANSGVITVRVPAKSFEKAIAEFKKLGKLQNINVSGTDVTEEYVDIESRLKSLRAQEAILLRLMEKATSIADTIAVETRLSEVQTQIEQLTGRKNFLDNRVAFAAIEINLFEPSAQPVVGWGLREALVRAARAFVATIAGFIYALGVLGPYLILGGIGILIYLRSRKKRTTVA
jgi:hypothetical protein